MGTYTIKTNKYETNGGHISVSVYSDIGDREYQEDSYLITFREGILLVAVCDGMGGSKGGDIASQTVITQLRKNFEIKPRDDTAFYTNILDVVYR